jgi:NAD(P)-dependent dehydrogenase (short-subunit alcohol dehydrogenase family)
VRKLANRGYAVVVGYIRDRGAADSIVEEVLAAGGTALTIRADVADELDVERMFAETDAFGGVDVVVHAAGQVSPGPDTDHDLDRFDALQRTNVRGTFLGRLPRGDPQHAGLRVLGQADRNRRRVPLASVADRFHTCAHPVAGGIERHTTAVSTEFAAASSVQELARRCSPRRRVSKP